MRVSDLIKELKKLNPDSILQTYTLTKYGSWSWETITDVDFGNKYSPYIKISFKTGI